MSLSNTIKVGATLLSVSGLLYFGRQADKTYSPDVHRVMAIERQFRGSNAREADEPAYNFLKKEHEKLISNPQIKERVSAYKYNSNLASFSLLTFGLSISALMLPSRIKTFQ